MRRVLQAMSGRTRRVVGVFDERRTTRLLRGLRDRRVSKDLDRKATEQHRLAYADPSRASPAGLSTLEATGFSAGQHQLARKQSTEARTPPDARRRTRRGALWTW